MIFEKILASDIIIFATPVWWGNQSSLIQKVIERIVPSKNHICGLHSYVSCCTNGNPYIGLGQGMTVVNAVSYHGYPFSLPLELTDLHSLVPRQYIGKNSLDSKLFRYALGGDAVVPWQHGDLDAHRCQSFHDLFAGGTYCVSNCKGTLKSAIYGSED
jgi:hypothetical protein